MARKRRALVTGAGRHIGARIATVLAEQGVVVFVNDRTAEQTQETVQTIIDAGGEAHPAATDVGDLGALTALTASIAPIDVLVNNVGLPLDRQVRVDFARSAPGDWDRILDAGLRTVLNSTRAVLPGMLEASWGRIVSIASDAGRIGMPNQSVYSAAKAGVIGFARSLALDVAKSGITVNCVSLGSVPAPEVPNDRRNRLTKAYPVGRLGTPDDVASAVAYFASDGASWVTGQVLSVNGGFATF